MISITTLGDDMSYDNYKSNWIFIVVTSSAGFALAPRGPP